MGRAPAGKMGFATRLPLRTTPLVDFVIIEKGRQVRPIFQAALMFIVLEFLAGSIRFVAPPPFTKEGAPDEDLLLIRLSAVREAPLQDFLVGPSLQNPRAKSCIFHSQETGATSIEAIAQIGMIWGR